MRRSALAVMALAVGSALFTQTPTDRAEAQTVPPGAFAGGTPTVLTRSGAWSWFGSPRATITDCELMVGSVASGSSPDGAARAGDVDVTTLRLTDSTIHTDTLAQGLQIDDHNNPGLLEMPNGKIVAGYARHHADPHVRNAVRPRYLDHWVDRPNVTDPARVTYSNMIHLRERGGPLGTTYNFYRGDGFDPNALSSTDHGTSWKKRGPFLRKYRSRPYPVYDDNGLDRIDVATTEGHPREYRLGTGIYHGYVQNDILYTTDGHPAGPIGYGAAPEELTRVWLQTATKRGWTHDIQQVPGAHSVIAFSVRDGSAGLPQHLRLTYHYAWWTGSKWETSQIAYAGNHLLNSEVDYAGGLAIDPADPNHVVLSTDVDPVTGYQLGSGYHELYDGFTSDGGQTWSFTPITSGSMVDNLRPIIPDRTDSTRALVWLRGEYRHFVDYTAEAVAIVDDDGTTDCVEPMQLTGAVPFKGDFDGDGLIDYFDYQPGPTKDTVFWGNGDRTAVSVSGTYQPIVHRPVGSDRDHIIWSSPSGGYRWVADGHTFRSTPYNVERGSQMMVGDFDGDGNDDLFFYRPGPGADSIHYADGRVERVQVNGNYIPVTGDFDGDGRTDIFWYAPGPAADYYWLFEADGIRSIPATVNGHYQPAVGRADDDATDALLWLLPDGRSYVWFHDQPGGPPAHRSVFNN